jgi:hypothetical protein
MDNGYFIVSWIHETPIRNSVMSQADVIDPEVRRARPEELIGEEVEFRWKGRQNCTGKVTAHGK